MPNVIRSLRGHRPSVGRSFCTVRLLRRCGLSCRGMFGSSTSIFQHATHRARTQIEAGPRQRLGDSFPAQAWKKHLQPPNRVVHQLRGFVDRFPNLYERRFARIIDAFQPGCDDRGLGEKASRCLSLRPATRGFELENRHSFDRPLVRTPVSVDHCHPGILDPKLLFEQRDLIQRAPEIAGQTRSSVRTVYE